MKELIEGVQIINNDGIPVFAVLPWCDFMAIEPELKRQRAIRKGIPNEVMRLSFDRDISLLAAWREHLGLSQAMVADKAGMKQSALSRIEKGNGKLQRSTIIRLAAALGLHSEQLESYTKATRNK